MQIVQSYNIRNVSRYLLKNDKNVYIPTVDVTLYISDNRYNKDEEIAMNANYYQKVFKKKKVVVITYDNNLIIRCTSSNVESFSPSHFYKKYN